ncbi:MAG: RDD family protein [Thermoguttaceae bacterium]
MQDADLSQSGPPVAADLVDDRQLFYVARKGKRFINCVIDLVGWLVFAEIVILPVGLLLDVIGPHFGRRSFCNYMLYHYGPFIVQVHMSMTCVAYYFLQEYAWGRTLGKFVTRTIVISADGCRPTGRQIVGRTLARLIPFEALSYLFGQKYPVGIHDEISNTRVVDKPRRPKSM